MSNLLIKNAYVVTFSGENPVLEDHGVLIENGKIKRIAPSADFADFDGKIIDAGGKIVAPGFVCAHMHYYSTLVRGLGKAAPSYNFNEVLENLWWRLDKKLNAQDNYYSAIIPMIDAIKKGTTTLIDHHASPFAVEGSLDVIAKAAKETGIRTSLCYELSDRDGKEIALAGIKENMDFIKRCEKENDEHLRAMFGLHASFTVGNETLERAVSEMQGHNTGFHVHTAEGLSDQEACLKEHGMRVVERFEKMGVLGEKSICVHCVHVDDNEMEILAKTNTPVVCNTQSNMNNAVGIPDIIKMNERGILVGLGTDAMTVNMLEEVRAAMWGQKYLHRDPSVGFMEITSALTANNSEIADRQWNGFGLGKLVEGGAADVIVLDQFPPTELNGGTALGHLVFGFASATVDTTIVAGKVLMENKKLCLDIDEKELNAKSRETAAKLWERF
jgi:putative selenium metabolism protein SsnA